MDMSNNDILRRIRYAFDFSDGEMIDIFKQGECHVTRAQVSSWLKKDTDADFKPLADATMARFLNGFICKRRGKREGAQPEVELTLNNNIIFRKLKIALDLKAEDVLALLEIGGQRVSKHELSAFFRNPAHRQYRECQNQILRKFLHGVQEKYRKLPS